ncbi:hypothetical protein H5410_035000 [Solanum commersonii]|uniref:Uncharacterized protein n=1 Tax=Solanum commersonii TaxID=4109 RepID=A0A9J5Y2K5_SOLCO|nr:hypothetical protein H5410_035000 [Solanum commersonii]
MTQDHYREGCSKCTTGSLPTTHLGLPPGATVGSTSIWDGVIEKFEKRLASQQMQYLSMGGRSTLINSVLTRIRRNCLWDGNQKFHRPNQSGGLGIKDLVLHN